jgi:hypothetical protein
MFGVTQVSKSLFKSIINWMDLNMALLTAKTLCFYECAKTPPVHNNNNNNNNNNIVFFGFKSGNVG